MAGVRETGNSPGGAAYVPETDTRAAKKALELEAGNVLVEQTVRQIAKEREMIKKEQEAQKDRDNQNRQEDTEPKDTPELSKQSKWFGIGEKLLEQENLKWSLEMEEQWEAFLNWLPVKGADLSTQLSELSDLYMALLEALLTHTAGEEQAAQKEMLDTLLAQKLSLLLDMDLKDLMKLLEESGQIETINSIKAELYKKTTGESISAREAGKFYAKGRSVSVTSSRYFVPETAPAKQDNTGVLYRRSGARSVQVSQEFNAQKNSGELQMDQRNRVLGGARGQNGAGSTGVSGKGASLTGQELAKANSFAGHAGNSGNLLSGREISAKNDEVAGLLAGITSIKGQIYSETAGRNSMLKTPVKSALNQFIDYYLTQKGMYKTYYYTTNAYERTGSAQKAVEESIEYAYRQFLEKKNDEAYRRQAAYSGQAGFFQAMLKDMTMEEELRRGLRFLEENWRAFLQSIGEEEQKDLLVTLQKYSRWGELLRPEVKKDRRKEKPQAPRRERITVAQIVGVAAVVMVYVLYRLFF